MDTYWIISTAECSPEAEDVRLGTLMVDGEHGACPPEPCPCLIADPENPILGAESPRLGEVPLARDPDVVLGLDRFHHEAAHVGGPQGFLRKSARVSPSALGSRLKIDLS